MSANSSIEWTDATWNPVRGCSRVSPGCVNCYAERQALRFAKAGGPFHTFVGKVNGHPAWTGKVELVEKHLADPLKWREPRRIFVNSMSDLFHEELPDEAIDRVFAVMALASQHTFQILTKRPERMLHWATRTRGNHCVETLNIGTGRVRSGSWIDPIENVSLGVSVEDQQRADERIPLLLKTPAAVRFVSYEPALGPVEFTSIPRCMDDNEPSREQLGGPLGMHYMRHGAPGIDWLIVGGESGPGARPFDVQWARDVVEQCKAAGVACFVKQFGAKPFVRSRAPQWPKGATFTIMSMNEPQVYPRQLVGLKDRKGGDMLEWPEDLRVREFPPATAARPSANTTGPLSRPSPAEGRQQKGSSQEGAF